MPAAAFASRAGADAPALPVKAAKQLEPLDAALARQTYLDAWHAALFAGRFAGAGDLHEVSGAARPVSILPAIVAPRETLGISTDAILVGERDSGAIGQQKTLTASNSASHPWRIR